MNRMLIALAGVMFSAVSNAQTHVSVYPEAQQLNFEQTVRVFDVSTTLLNTLKTADRCGVHWPSVSLHEVSSMRDRDPLIEALNQAGHPELLQSVERVPAYPMVDISLDPDLARLLPINNPMLQGDYQLSRSCEGASVLVMSWQYGARLLEWKPRWDATEALQSIGWDYNGSATIVYDRQLNAVDINHYQNDHHNLPINSVLVLNDAPNPAHNSALTNEVAQWGMLWRLN